MSEFGIYMPDDVIYMRFFQADKVLRVARADVDGLVLALYPQPDGDFSLEAFREMDDGNEKKPVRRTELKDKVWLKLLDGENIEKVLANYEPVGGSGTDNKGSYYYAKRGSDPIQLRKRTFHITDDTREEDVLAKAALRSSS